MKAILAIFLSSVDSNSQPISKGTSLPETSQTELEFTYSEISELISYQYNTDSSGKIMIHGIYAFVASSDITLTVYNISNPLMIEYVRHFSLSGVVNDFCINDNYLYVALDYGAIDIYDIHDIAGPTVLVGSLYDFNGAIKSVIADGKILIASDFSGVQFLSDRWDGPFGANPDQQISMANVQALSKSGNRLFIGRENGQLLGYNIPRLDQIPQFIGDIFIPSEINTIKQHGNLLYVGATLQFHIINSSDYSFLGSYGVINVSSIAVQNKYVYVAEGHYVTILDVSNEADVKLFARMNFGEDVYSVELYGEYLLVGTQTSFRAVKVGQYVTPKNLFTATGTAEYSTVISGHYSYTAMGPNGVYIYDMRNYQLVSQIPIVSDPVIDIYIEGEIAYVFDSAPSVRFINISNPHNPSFIKQEGLYSPNFKKVSVFNNLMILNQLTDGIKILNFSDRMTLGEFGGPFSVSAGGYSYDSVVYNNTVYVAEYNRLRAINISNVFSPSEISSIQIDYIFSVDIDYPFLYAGTNSGVRIFNIQDGLDGVVEYLDPISANTFDVQRSGNMLYTAAKGLQMYNVSEIETKKGYYHQETVGRFLSIQEDIVTVTHSFNGFTFYKIMEVAGDELDGIGKSYLERIFRPTDSDDNDDKDQDDNENNRGNSGKGETDLSNIDWMDMIKYIGPVGIIAIIGFIIVKSKRNRGLKPKKTGGKIGEEAIQQFTDDFFDSEF